MRTRLPDFLLHPSDRMLRQFAAGLVVFCLGAAVFAFRAHGPAPSGFGFAAVAGVAAAAGWQRPGLLRPVYVVLGVASWPVGWIVSSLALAVLFFGAVTPLALLFRLIGRDRLKRRRRAGVSTHWQSVRPRSDPRDYQRPF